MRLATTSDGRAGRIEGDLFVPLAPSVSEVLAGAAPREAGPAVPLGDVVLGPPIRPTTLIGVGLNYRDHVAEAGLELPPAPLLFAKLPGSVIGPGEPIVSPAGDVQLDYEAELGVVIGRAARDVPVERALAHVAGYTCVNDVSERRAQFGDGQWLRGKSFDTFAPVGPVVVTADEIDDPQALAVSCTVDGEVRQSSSTAAMVFGVAEIVAHCSRSFTLHPGTLIATGTPAGVGMADGRWLRPGQVVTVEVEGIGALTNPVA
ncbi:MAG: fumarylacetoacetate hydrolase family protein [Acidimicrobiia bacterium]